MFTHSGKLPFHCSICGKSYANSANYRIHMRVHEGKYIKKVKRDKLIEKIGSTNVLQCDVCDQKCLTKEEFIQHWYEHQKAFLCNICGKKFNSNYHLQVHNLLHTGEKPHKCEYCEKSFRLESCLKIHLRNHTGEKPYRCKQCNRSFTQRPHLLVHIRTHTGEKPYLCNICGKRFADKPNFLVHHRIHTGQTNYACGDCNKGFYSTTALKKHQKCHFAVKKEQEN